MAKKRIEFRSKFIVIAYKATEIPNFSKNNESTRNNYT